MDEARTRGRTGTWGHKFRRAPSRKNAALACVSGSHLTVALFKPEKIPPPISKCGCCIVLKPDLPSLPLLGAEEGIAI